MAQRCTFVWQIHDIKKWTPLGFSILGVLRLAHVFDLMSLRFAFYLFFAVHRMVAELFVISHSKNRFALALSEYFSGGSGAVGQRGAIFEQFWGAG